MGVTGGRPYFFPAGEISHGHIPPDPRDESKPLSDPEQPKPSCVYNSRFLCVAARSNDSKGRHMACKVLVGMQGRIDATRLFNNQLMTIFVKSKCVRLLWDRQLVCYHTGPLVGSDSSLSDILLAIKGHKDTSPQTAPVGYALIGWHVDDGTGLACDVAWNLDHETNRVVQYLCGQIAVTFATTLTGWHGNKALGFTLTLNDELKSVNLSAPDS